LFYIFRYFYHIIKSFFNDETTFYAASLSFFTIFSILPIIALILAIFSSLHFFDQYSSKILAFLLDILNPSNSSDFLLLLKHFLSNISKLGYFGIGYIVIVFALFFKNYEYIVNKIHKTKRKSIYSSFIFYLFFLLFLLFAIALFIFSQGFYKSSFLTLLVSFMFGFCIIFSLFKFSVNKKISNKAAFVSAFTTTLVLSLTKNSFYYYIYYNKTYATIYGSFATLFFFFFWIYVSWIIFLYGVKFCYKLDRAFSIHKSF